MLDFIGLGELRWCHTPNSFSIAKLTVGKKLGSQKFPERAFQALQSYLIKAMPQK